MATTKKVNYGLDERLVKRVDELRGTFGSKTQVVSAALFGFFSLSYEQQTELMQRLGKWRESGKPIPKAG